MQTFNMQFKRFQVHSYIEGSNSVEALRPTRHIIGHFVDDFFRSYDQTNSVKALKETSWSCR